MSTIAERVAAGAAFLDERKPGWDGQISLYHLNIASDCNCILGQLGGGFFNGALDFGLTSDRQTRPLGFTGAPSLYRALTAEWRRVIEARRAAP